MKRSEMITLITNSIYENISYYGECEGLDTSRVDKILEDIERAGMLPPVLSKYENCHFDVSSHSGQSVEDYHDWDKED